MKPRTKRFIKFWGFVAVFGGYIYFLYIFGLTYFAPSKTLTLYIGNEGIFEIILFSMLIPFSAYLLYSYFAKGEGYYDC